MEDLLRISDIFEYVDIKLAAIIIMLSHITCCMCSATTRKAKMIITICIAYFACYSFGYTGEYSIVTPLVAIVMYDLGYKKIIKMLKNKGDE